jgi:hypothetical protein
MNEARFKITICDLEIRAPRIVVIVNLPSHRRYAASVLTARSPCCVHGNSGLAH